MPVLMVVARLSCSNQISTGFPSNPLSIQYKIIILIFSPFTAQARNISGLKNARTRLQTVYFPGPITNLLSVLRVLWLFNNDKVCFVDIYHLFTSTEKMHGMFEFHNFSLTW